MRFVEAAASFLPLQPVNPRDEALTQVLLQLYQQMYTSQMEVRPSAAAGASSPLSASRTHTRAIPSRFHDKDEDDDKDDDDEDDEDDDDDDDDEDEPDLTDEAHYIAVYDDENIPDSDDEYNEDDLNEEPEDSTDSLDESDKRTDTAKERTMAVLFSRVENDIADCLDSLVGTGKLFPNLSKAANLLPWVTSMCLELDQHFHLDDVGKLSLRDPKKMTSLPSIVFDPPRKDTRQFTWYLTAFLAFMMSCQGPLAESLRQLAVKSGIRERKEPLTVDELIGVGARRKLAKLIDKAGCYAILVRDSNAATIGMSSSQGLSKRTAHYSALEAQVEAARKAASQKPNKKNKAGAPAKIIPFIDASVYDPEPFALIWLDKPDLFGQNVPGVMWYPTESIINILCRASTTSLQRVETYAKNLQEGRVRRRGAEAIVGLNSNFADYSGAMALCDIVYGMWEARNGLKMVNPARGNEADAAADWHARFPGIFSNVHYRAIFLYLKGNRGIMALAINLWEIKTGKTWNSMAIPGKPLYLGAD